HLLLATGRVGSLGLLFLIAILPPGRLASAGKRGEPTFYGDVLPILKQPCQNCHRRGEIAPMPLVTYEQTRPWAGAIRAAVRSKGMPPWFADPRYGRFSN